MRLVACVYYTVNMNEQSRLEVLFEDLNHRFDGLIEVVSAMQADINEMKPMVACIPAMLQDIRSIKLVSREHSLQLNDQEARLDKLEAA